MILASQLHAVKKKLRKEAFNNSGFDRTLRSLGFCSKLFVRIKA